jgi:hypothetical protein
LDAAPEAPVNARVAPEGLAASSVVRNAFASVSILSGVAGEHPASKWFSRHPDWLQR